MDQYERNIRLVRNDLPKPEGLTGILFSQETWCGVFNPDKNDTNPEQIRFFDGIGMDGDGDGKAEITNDMDVLFSFANYLLQYGTDHDNIKIGLWEYYKRDKTVSMIINMAKLYKTFGTLNLDERHFPLPIRANYSYRNTWGRKGLGRQKNSRRNGYFRRLRRNVYSTCYGVVEMKG